MSMQNSRKPAGVGVRPDFAWSRRTLLAAAIALQLSVPAMAQETSSSDDSEPTQLDAVNVRGVRASLIKSQVIKRDSEQIVDSVSAEDIGALPDRSVTETLQRVSGVTIDHFMARNDPDHFSAEGSGVMIRGLTQVRGELNGRDIFSAASGRGLSFEDVPAELMAGVDVYKNPSAEIVEGGLGGTVNLRTRLPFDNEGRVIGGNVDVNYGDFSKKYKPSASFLYSDRWKVGDGEMGFMFDVAHSELNTRTDGVQVEPFVRRNDPEALAGTNFDNVYLPAGVNWRQLDFGRKRDGIAAAWQWRPSDDTEIQVQYLRSRYEMNWQERAAFFGDGNINVIPAAGTTFNYDDEGRFISGTPQSNSWRGNLTGNGVRFSTDNRYADQHTTTSDLSASFKHYLNQNLVLKGDVQLVQSENEASDLTVFSGVYLPGMTYDLSGTYPSVTVADPGYLANPDNYFWSAAMDHKAHNKGRELATRADLEYTFEDSSWLRMLRFGMRATDRTQTNHNATYNWGVLSDTWATPLPGSANGLADLGHYITSGSSLFSFSNFFRGKVQIPNGVYLPTDGLAKNYGEAAELLQEISSQTGGWKPVQYNLQDTNLQKERTQAGYLALYFGHDGDDGRGIDGNVGVRVVQTKTQADGYGQFQDQSAANLPAELSDVFNGRYFPLETKGSYTDVLPSLNVRFKLSEDLQLRLAASKAIARPDYSQLQSYLLLSADVDTEGNVLRYLGTAGNPTLKPMKADQFDASIEWYFDSSDMLYGTLFYKSVQDYFATQTHTENYEGRDFLVTRPENMDKGIIRGFEFGYTQFFDSLPGWMDGFGINANFTFVDSRGGTNSSTDPFSQTTVTGVSLPLEGLSRRSYNLAGIYEKGPISARVAYNWRSRYLLTTSDAATKLPTWADDFGQLDASVFYRFNPHWQVGIQANNISNSITKVLMGPTVYEDGEVDSKLYHRAWFVNDRRYSLVLRANW